MGNRIDLSVPAASIVPVAAQAGVPITIMNMVTRNMTILRAA